MRGSLEVERKRLRSLRSPEARRAEHGTASFRLRLRLERHLTLGTTLGADSVELLVPLILALVAAILAALWRVEVPGGVELLFALRERECGTAVAAGDLLICHTEKWKEGSKCAIPSTRFLVVTDSVCSKDFAGPVYRPVWLCQRPKGLFEAIL